MLACCEASMYLCFGFCLEGMWDTFSNRQVVGVVLLVVMLPHTLPYD